MSPSLVTQSQIILNEIEGEQNIGQNTFFCFSCFSEQKM